MLLLVVFYLAMIGELAFLDFLIYASFSFLFIQKTGSSKKVESVQEKDWLDQTIKALAPSLP